MSQIGRLSKHRNPNFCTKTVLVVKEFLIHVLCCARGKRTNWEGAICLQLKYFNCEQPNTYHLDLFGHWPEPVTTKQAMPAYPLPLV